MKRSEVLSACGAKAAVITPVGGILDADVVGDGHFFPLLPLRFTIPNCTSSSWN